MLKRIQILQNGFWIDASSAKFAATLFMPFTCMSSFLPQVDFVHVLDT